MTLELKQFLASGSAVLLLAYPAIAQDGTDIDFGDDSSIWANDGQCDDPRFEGTGMSDLPNAIDIKADASDCEALMGAGEITLLEDSATGLSEATDNDEDIVDVDEAANAETQGDTEDPVDVDEAASAEPPADPASDAAESPETSSGASKSSTGIDFGDDTSMFANDGECDDARFVGAGLTQTGLLESDISHDANDCRAAFETGKLRLRTSGDPSAESLVGTPSPLAEALTPSPDETNKADAAPQSYGPPETSTMFNGVEFGDDQSRWSGDGECDDPRFEGKGMTSTPLLEKDTLHDASDCLAAWKTGELKLK